MTTVAIGGFSRDEETLSREPLVPTALVLAPLQPLLPAEKWTEAAEWIDDFVWSELQRREAGKTTMEEHSVEPIVLESGQRGLRRTWQVGRIDEIEFARAEGLPRVDADALLKRYLSTGELVLAPGTPGY